MHYTDTKLKEAINAVNERYFAGRSDDDQVADMIRIDRKTKGFSFLPEYETYKLCTDYGKLKNLANRYGYWSPEVQEFNEVLKLKGNFPYMEELNNRLKEEQRN